MIAIGVNTEGYREVLGLMLGDSESEASWSQFFSWLKSRNLRGVDLVVSDGHSGLVKAVRRHFQGITWQRCQTHFMRNIMDAKVNNIDDPAKLQVGQKLFIPDINQMSFTSKEGAAITSYSYVTFDPDTLLKGIEDKSVVKRNGYNQRRKCFLCSRVS